MTGHGANLSTFCRSLLAGDSERGPASHVRHRLPAGSYISTKPHHFFPEPSI